MERVRVYDKNGVPARTGTGLYARTLLEDYPLLPVEEEGRLNDPRIREDFITRVFTYDRWLQLVESNPEPRDVVAFHTGHKMLVLAHSPKHYRMLGPLVAKAGVLSMDELLHKYEANLMEGMKQIASPGRHVNVLQHLAGYLKDDIRDDDKRELHSVFNDYRRGHVPLITPLVLLHHHLKHLRDDWVDAQVYLQPFGSTQRNLNREDADRSSQQDPHRWSNPTNTGKLSLYRLRIRNRMRRCRDDPAWTPDCGRSP
jgi:uncharacterized protein YbgA (DUF1722 family)